MKISSQSASQSINSLKNSNNSHNSYPTKKETNQSKRTGDNMKHTSLKGYPGFLHEIRDKVSKPTIINNSLNIKKGEVFSLGEYDNVKIVAERKQNGYIRGSNSPKASKVKTDHNRFEGGYKVPPEEIKASKIKSSFSIKQHNDISDTTTLLSQLLITADGEQSIEELNSSFSDPYQYQNLDIEKELKRIGINPSEEFKINGQKFKLENKQINKV